jgi:beta-glucanase (GH16 family)
MVLMLSVAVCGGRGGAPPQPLSGEHVLVFEDEFDGVELNPENWTAKCPGCRQENGEQGAYSAKNVMVSGGTLKIIARNDGADGLPFTTGRIRSDGLKEFTYGRFSARIKVPRGRGFWPAFWMLGSDIHQVGWPRCGEIDIMEAFGDGDWTSGAIHGPFGWFGRHRFIDKHFPLTSPITGWHEYGLEWDPAFLEWYVDGQKLWRVERTAVNPWVFSRPQFLIVSLGVGGFGPHVYNKTTLPFNGVPQETVDIITEGGGVLEVDWVRVYQRRN